MNSLICLTDFIIYAYYREHENVVFLPILKKNVGTILELSEKERKTAGPIVTSLGSRLKKLDYKRIKGDVEMKKLIDLHAHTSGISKCCVIDALLVLEEAKRIGLDGIVLTNHYQKSYVEDNDAKGFAEKYIREFDYTKALGDKFGIKVIFGIEVTMKLYPNVYMLVYGVDTDFIEKFPLIYDYTQKELYDTVKKNGGVLIQAHPFRNGSTVLDTKFLDGIEINCHPLYKKSYSKELIDIAEKEKLAVTCGGDYHADTYRPKCGMYLPDDIDDGIALGKYISEEKNFSLCVQEPNDDEIKTVEVNIPF